MKGEISSGLLPVGVQCAVGEVFNGRLIGDAFQNDVRGTWTKRVRPDYYYSTAKLWGRERSPW